MGKKKSWSKFWKEYKWYLIIAFCLVIIVFIYLVNMDKTEPVIDEKKKEIEEEKQRKILDPLIKKKTPETPPLKRKKCEKKSEKKCKEILEQIFNKPFVSIRPDCLKYPKSKRNLELDMYAEIPSENGVIKLALEYQGRQHYMHVPYFTPRYEDFLAQLERDKWKKARCSELGIVLIEVPYTIKFDDLEMYILSELERLGIKP